MGHQPEKSDLIKFANNSVEVIEAYERLAVRAALFLGLLYGLVRTLMHL